MSRKQENSRRAMLKKKQQNINDAKMFKSMENELLRRIEYITDAEECRLLQEQLTWVRYCKGHIGQKGF